MKIRMLTAIGGADFSIAAGEETERFSKKECIRLIESGQAVPVAAAPEKAIRRAPEKRAGAAAKPTIGKRIKKALGVE